MSEHDDLDEALEAVERMLRVGKHAAARRQLASFVARYTARVDHEERALRAGPGRRRELLAKVRQEHARLGVLVAALVDALAREHARSGLEVIEMLRSVFVLHVAKEASLPELAEAPLAS